MNQEVTIQDIHQLSKEEASPARCRYPKKKIVDHFNLTH